VEIDISSQVFVDCWSREVLKVIVTFCSQLWYTDKALNKYLPAILQPGSLTACQVWDSLIERELVCLTAGIFCREVAGLGVSILCREMSRLWANVIWYHINSYRRNSFGLLGSGRSATACVGSFLRMTILHRCCRDVTIGRGGWCSSIRPSNRHLSMHT